MFFFFGHSALKLTFEERGDFDINGKKKLTILELSTFLYDFNLLHDCVVLAVLPEYDHYKFSQYFWYRKGRPVKQEHKLYLNKINHNSPLGLEVIIPLTAATLGIPWLLMQAFEKIQNWKLNREKLELEVEKLRLDAQQKKTDGFMQDIELDNLLKKRQAIATFNRIVKRLEERQLIATDIQVFTLRPDEDEDNDNNRKQ